MVGQGATYHCHTCGFRARSLHWQCPGCKHWGTVQKQAAVGRRGAGGGVAAGVAGVEVTVADATVADATVAGAAAADNTRATAG